MEQNLSNFWKTISSISKNSQSLEVNLCFSSVAAGQGRYECAWEPKVVQCEKHPRDGGNFSTHMTILVFEDICHMCVCMLYIYRSNVSKVYAINMDYGFGAKILLYVNVWWVFFGFVQSCLLLPTDMTYETRSMFLVAPCMIGFHTRTTSH